MTCCSDKGVTRFLHVSFIISSVRRFWNEVWFDMGFNTSTWLVLE